MAKTRIPEHDGREVASVSIIITNTGDGLSKSMGVAPVIHKINGRAFVVLEVVCSKIRHDPIDPKNLGGALERVQIYKAEAATFADTKEIRDLLEKQKIALEQAEGVQRLPIGDKDTDEL
jgi:hypothetical protein